MNRKMYAVVLKEHGILSYEPVLVPSLRKGQVQLEICYCGVCGSDVGMVYEHAQRYPLIPGHEFTGIVRKVADGENKWLLGRQVTAYPIIGCGACPMCLAGDYTKCASYGFVGSRSNGAYAQFLNIPAQNVIELGGIPLRQGALIEPLAVAVHAVRRIPEKALKHCAVIGAGPVGLLVAQVCRAFHADLVTLIDVDDKKVGLAKAFGFETSFNSTGLDDSREKMRELGAELGATAVFECSGTAPGFMSALNLAAPDASVVMVGIHKRGIPLTPGDARAVMKKELLVTGAWVSNYDASNPENDWAVSMNLIKNGKVNLEKLITAEIPLEQAPSALNQIRENPAENIKTLICMHQ